MKNSEHMATGKKDIYVFAHWLGMQEPKYVGILSVHQAKSRKAIGFEYDGRWLALNGPVLLDPDVSWYPGPQFPVGKECFGMFLDSMPDTWGRTLMKRRSTNTAKKMGVSAANLYEVDFLLGVYDQSRMGGLRFKLEMEGPFLDDNHQASAPPWSTVSELQHGAEMLEKGDDHAEADKWLDILMVPGSSLGGARPKANALEETGHGEVQVAVMGWKNSPMKSEFQERSRV